MTANMMFGIHAANGGGQSALMAKVAEMVCSRMYAADSARPTPRCMPMPPLRFWEESDMPMMVRMKDAKEVAMRLCRST